MSAGCALKAWDDALASKPGYTSIDVKAVQTNHSGLSDSSYTLGVYLDQCCTGSNLCYVVNYSGGDAVMGHRFANSSTNWNINWVGTSAGAGGGSALSGNFLADIFGPCDYSGHLGRSEVRNAYNHNDTNGERVYRIGGYDGWWYTSWLLPGEDDGAVAYHSAGSRTSVTGTSSMCSGPKWTNHVPAWTCAGYDLEPLRDEVEIHFESRLVTRLGRGNGRRARGSAFGGATATQPPLPRPALRPGRECPCGRPRHRLDVRRFDRPDRPPRSTAKAAPPSPSSPEPRKSPGEADPASKLEELLGDLDALPPEIRSYLDSTTYPPGAGQLTNDHVDLLEPNQRHEDFRPIPETMSLNPDEVVTVRLTSERYFYTGDEPVNVDLEIRLGAQPIRPANIQSFVSREGRGGDEGRRSPLRFRNEGDGFAARIDTARFADHHGNLRVDVRLEYAPGQFHEESLRLFLTPEGMIPARFTGEVHDRVVNGSLRVWIGIRVEQPGSYRIDANLYDRFGEPVAFSAFKGELTRANKEVPVDFFGRLLRDSGASGPFILGQVRGYRFIDGGHPDRERIPDLAGVFRTELVDTAALSDAVYAGPDKLRMVNLLMEDLANGLTIDAPAPPSDAASAETNDLGGTEPSLTPGA